MLSAHMSNLQLGESSQNVGQVKKSTASSQRIAAGSASQPLASKSAKSHTNISEDLLKKFREHPDLCFIPFCIPVSTTNSLYNGANVQLPFNISKSGENNYGGNWEVITKQLLGLKESCQNNNLQNLSGAIQATIQGYPKDSMHRSNFQMLNRPDISEMLRNTLPIIIAQALQLPLLLERPIPVLNTQTSKTIYLTRRLCCSLLANAFFCTIPEPSIRDLADYNWFRLYNDTQSQRCEVKKEKIKCLLSYFQYMSRLEKEEKFQNQIISFERRCVSKKIDWSKESGPLCEVRVEPHKKIEDAEGMLQTDFANRFVGGGVLNDGCVMEEIRFSISPELLVSRLFTQALSNDEVLVVTGTEIFSLYSGYSTSFQYTKPKAIDIDQQRTDNYGRTFTQIVAMDASRFKRNETTIQFESRHIDRELHKANVAFIHGKAATPRPVATGNWGCGAFNGNPELKFLIQWMAASHQNRPSIVYHTIGDQHQTNALFDINDLLLKKKVSVGSLYKAILQFSRDAGYQNASLFEYVKSYFNAASTKRT